MQNSGILEKIAMVLDARKSETAEKSYAAYLYQQGREAILDKVNEEAGEMCVAARQDDKQNLVHEVADLWFHCMVLLAHRNIRLQEVFTELERRFGTSGHAEKRRRNK